MINIRYPNITGRTPEEKLAQMESYLRQLVNELNWALQTIEKNAGQNGQNNTNVRR